MAILLLEDEILISLDLQDVLEAAGYQVAAFASAKQAKAWLGSNTPQAAIVDLSLRDGNCLALAQGLDRDGIPVIVHTGTQVSGTGLGEALENATVLNKPADYDALLRVLRAKLDPDVMPRSCA